MDYDFLNKKLFKKNKPKKIQSLIQNFDKKISNFPGLKNLGNTCYLNSCLQLLSFTPGFKILVLDLKNFIKKFEEQKLSSTEIPDKFEDFRNLFNSMSDLLCLLGPQKTNHIKLEDYVNNTIDPSLFLEYVNEVDSRFGPLSEQQDVSEFFTFLFAYLDEGLNLFEKMIKNRKVSIIEDNFRKNDLYNPIERFNSLPKPTLNKNLETLFHTNEVPNLVFDRPDKIFQGIFSSTVQCIECEQFSVKNEFFYEISLKIEENKDIIWAIDKFTCKTKLNSKDKYFCDYCDHLCEAFKFTKIHELPNILVFHFQRFSWANSNLFFASAKKINYLVEFPQKLTLKTEWLSKKFINSPNYDLFGVIFHKGNSPNFGHYTCASKKNAENWVFFDDHIVYQASNNSFKKILDFDRFNTPYLIFYSLIQHSQPI